MAPSELKEFFKNYPPTKELQLNKSAKIIDTLLFMETCFLRMETYQGEVASCPSYWLLMELYEVVKLSMIKKEAF